MRSFLSGSLCFCLVLILSGCYTGPPTPFPRGYVSYTKPLKSAPGPTVRTIGYDYSNEKNTQVLEEMRFAARDLVEKLDQKFTFVNDEVYLKHAADSTFYRSFDYLLRDELMQHGYLLSDTPDGVVTIAFAAKKPAEICDGTHIRSPIYLALATDPIENTPRDFVGGFYEVPTYGYRKDSDMSIDVPSCSSGDRPPE